jgi:ABC-2 type transport system permease protein
MRARWFAEYMKAEVKLITSYNANFWFAGAVSVLTQIVLGYAIWSSVFEARGVETLNGYTLSGIVSYYFLNSMIYMVVWPVEFDFIADEIYQGRLTRHLIYPIPYLVARFATYLANSLFYAVQLILGLIIFYFYIPSASQAALSVPALVQGTLATSLAIYLCFIAVCCIQMIAFWIEQAWSFAVMFMFGVNFFGGFMIPIEFFPKVLKDIAEFLPFSYFLAFPVRSLLGRLSWEAWSHSMLIAALWALILTITGSAIFRRGLRQYTGVGI